MPNPVDRISRSIPHAAGANGASGVRSVSDRRFLPGSMIKALKQLPGGREMPAEYQIVRVLSDDGGMSQVFTAVEAGKSQEHVLKLMSFSKIETNPQLLEQMIQRFRVEVEVLRTLDHPNIVKLIARDINKYPEFYIMEKIECQPTLELFANYRNAIFAETDPAVQRKRVIELEVRGLAIISHALNGLIAFGERMKQFDPNAVFAHRDIKPENILFRREASGNFTGVLTDFGIAKIPEAAKDDKNLTKTGMIFGTPNYMAPEVAIQGAKIADQSSDVFSLGIMMCEMLAGYTPFQLEKPEYWSHFLTDAAFPQNMRNYIESMRQNRPNYLPENIFNIILKAVDPVQRNRFRSYVELKAVLDPFALELIGEYSRS